MSVAIKKSKINGKGVFTKRDFKKGEVILVWSPKFLTKLQVCKLTQTQKHYLYKEKNKYFFMQSPEKYVNHSCNPNTKSKNKSDIAIRNIKKGEEITSNYENGAPHITFKCKCGSEKCDGFVKKREKV